MPVGAEVGQLDLLEHATGILGEVRADLHELVELHLLGDDVLLEERGEDDGRSTGGLELTQVSSRPVNGPAEAMIGPLSGNPGMTSPEGRSRLLLTIGVDIGMLGFP